MIKHGNILSTHQNSLIRYQTYAPNYRITARIHYNALNFHSEIRGIVWYRLSYSKILRKFHNIQFCICMNGWNGCSNRVRMLEYLVGFAVLKLGENLSQKFEIITFFVLSYHYHMGLRILVGGVTSTSS